MSTLRVEQRETKAQFVRMTEDTLTVDLLDGRTISVPLAWFPRLFHGSAKERDSWRLIADGEGIHWPELDEDISVENLLLGKPSGESQTSFGKWLKKRERRRSPNRTPPNRAQKTRKS